YRTNYFILIVIILGKTTEYGKDAIGTSIFTAFFTAHKCNFASTFSEKVTRTVRQFSPHFAAKMRPSHTPVIRGLSFIFWFVSCGLITFLWAFAVGLLVTLLHASLRTPNLKARLNTFREEFRAVWRNY
ncbi:Hypothetical predicted protein, partial [Olea europaea subsp. europaea]